MRLIPSAMRNHETVAQSVNGEDMITGPHQTHARIMLSELQPERLVLFEGVKERAKRLAERHLDRGMFRRGQPGNFTAIAASLIDTKKWLTHGQMIDYNDAQSMGLTVEVRGSDDDQWQALWKLSASHGSPQRTRRSSNQTTHRFRCESAATSPSALPPRLVTMRRAAIDDPGVGGARYP